MRDITDFLIPILLCGWHVCMHTIDSVLYIFGKMKGFLYAFLDFFVTVWYDARDKPKERGT